MEDDNVSAVARPNFYQHAANVSKYSEAGGDEGGDTTHPEIDKPAGNFLYLLEDLKIALTLLYHNHTLPPDMCCLSV